MMNDMLTLTVLEGEFAIHQLPPDAAIPPDVLRADFFALTRTADELSLVCPAGIPVPGVRSEGGWAALKVEGPLDFALTGVLAGLSGALAAAGVSVFAISTFDTDYLLVRVERLPDAVRALREAGHTVDGQPPLLSASLTDIRRRDRAIHDDDWIIALLARAEYGVLATCAGSQPFSVARNFVYDQERHCIYLHGARKGRTYEMVHPGRQASFNVSEMGRLLPADEAGEMSVEYGGVVVFGRVHLVEDSEEAKAALQTLVEKYFPHLQAGRDYSPVRDVDLKITAVLRLDVKAWSGKQKKVAEDFPGAFRFGEYPQGQKEHL